MAGELVNMWWGLILLGLCAGVVSGTLRLGSGTILIPAMVLLFFFPQKSAQGTALAVMVPMALMGAFLYWKNPEIEVRLSLVALIVAGALVGSVVGSILAHRLPAHVLRKIFAVFLLAVALRMLFVPPGLRRAASTESPAAELRTASDKEGIAHDKTRDPSRK